MKFPIGTRVLIQNERSALYGMTGVIDQINDRSLPYRVTLSTIPYDGIATWFEEGELDELKEGERDEY